MSEKSLNMTPETLAEFLRKMGSVSATAELIRSDLASGAPANADGTVNLLKYLVWITGKRNGRLYKAENN